MINKIMDFEQGSLSEIETVKLFSDLVKTGTAWKLQGFYGRTAMDMIQGGVLSKDGEILIDLEDICE